MPKKWQTKNSIAWLKSEQESYSRIEENLTNRSDNLSLFLKYHQLKFWYRGDMCMLLFISCARDTPESISCAHRSRVYNVRHERRSAICTLMRYLCGLWRNYPLLNNDIRKKTRMFEQFKKTVRFIVCDYRLQFYFHALLHAWKKVLHTTETRQNLSYDVNLSSYLPQMTWPQIKTIPVSWCPTPIRSLSDKMAASNMCSSAPWNAGRWLVSWPVNHFSGVRSIRVHEIIKSCTRVTINVVRKIWYRTQLVHMTWLSLAHDIVSCVYDWNNMGSL